MDARVTLAPKVDTSDRAAFELHSPLLEARSLRKTYGPTVALENVSLGIVTGEIHAVLGENGAGKSTLVKILNGIVRPDVGEMSLREKLYTPHSLLNAREHGVSTAFQELSLLPNLSVASNLVLPRGKKNNFGLISARRNNDMAAAMLDQFGVDDIDPRDLVGDLSLASRQRLEIVRAIAQNPALLILDEPTAALTEPEWLFGLLDSLTRQGTAVLYISHRLAEVRRLCSRGTILRGGKSISTVSLRDVGDSAIFEMMVGASQAKLKPVVRASTARPVFQVKNASAVNFHDVSFDIHEGEILGLAALEGQGQRELLRSLAGVSKLHGGSVATLKGAADLSSSAAARRSGIGFLPEERKTEGIFSGLKTSANISISIKNSIARFGIVSARLERTAVEKIGERLDIPPRYQRRNIETLSGGNQQKAILARVMVSGANHLVLYDPTRGVDVGTKQTIYRNIREFVSGGKTVLIYSTELSELVQLCDRCVVLYGGRLAAVMSGTGLTEDRLVAAVTGHGVAEQ